MSLFESLRSLRFESRGDSIRGRLRACLGGRAPFSFLLIWSETGSHSPLLHSQSLNDLFKYETSALDGFRYPRSCKRV
jgi:hypothetical protein